ncbi:MAG: glycosyltransferase family 2 protein [Allosphingosinicella sp.]
MNNKSLGAVPSVRAATGPREAVIAEPPPRVAVIVPCFRAGATVAGVVAAIGPEVDRIYVVDDGCPEASGAALEGTASDPRLVVLRNPRNLGVGGALKRGYKAALEDGAEILVKLDADGQMDPAHIPRLVAPLVSGRADYAKGNRFAPPHRMPPGSDPKAAATMPPLRRLGNNILSFFHKGVTGYWNIVDPANGYTAIHRRAVESIDLEAVADCYFFETDLLFQLNLVDAVVTDVPLPARYAGEVSSLGIRKVLLRFPGLSLKRFVKRIWTKYFLQDFNVASFEMLVGLPLIVLGGAFGVYKWWVAVETGVAASAGSVMFAALPIIIGFQLLLSAVSYDISRTPSAPISRRGEG